MVNLDALHKDITTLVTELQQLTLDKGNLSDPEVLKKSQQLDKMIMDYYTLKKNK